MPEHPRGLEPAADRIPESARRRIGFALIAIGERPASADIEALEAGAFFDAFAGKAAEQLCRFCERLRRAKLGADMHRQPNKLERIARQGAREERLDLFNRDAEFRRVEPGRDIRMRLRIDVRVYAESDARLLFEGARDLFDELELEGALHMDRADAGLDGFAELVPRLPDARVDDFLGGKARSKRSR